MRREMLVLWDRGVSTKSPPSTLVLVRLKAVKGDKSPFLDPKGVLEFQGSRRPPAFVTQEALTACTQHRLRDELRAGECHLWIPEIECLLLCIRVYEHFLGDMIFFTFPVGLWLSKLRTPALQISFIPSCMFLSLHCEHQSFLCDKTAVAIHGCHPKGPSECALVNSAYFYVFWLFPEISLSLFGERWREMGNEHKLLEAGPGIAEVGQEGRRHSASTQPDFGLSHPYLSLHPNSPYCSKPKSRRLFQRSFCAHPDTQHFLLSTSVPQPWWKAMVCGLVFFCFAQIGSVAQLVCELLEGRIVSSSLLPRQSLAQSWT